MKKNKDTKRREWEFNVMTLKEAMAWLDSKGIKYELCDTPVPVLANKANCGVPLGYAKPLDALSKHVDKDDSAKCGLIDSGGRGQQAIFINESGLYPSIVSSKLPQAKVFKRWVTSEVLLQIRQTSGSWRLSLGSRSASGVR